MLGIGLAAMKSRLHRGRLELKRLEKLLAALSSAVLVGSLMLSASVGVSTVAGAAPAAGLAQEIAQPHSRRAPGAVGRITDPAG